MKRYNSFVIALLILTLFSSCQQSVTTIAQENDFLRAYQLKAIEDEKADWGYWGSRPTEFTYWRNHSNRLIPIYSFGIKLDAFNGENSVYRDQEKLTQLYGYLPTETLNIKAEYFDQTDVYQLQKQAISQGKKYVVLIVFDGMDWETTRAAAIFRNKAVTYEKGRGNGLYFQDYDKVETDFGFCVTSPRTKDVKFDVDSQLVLDAGATANDGGYSAEIGGAAPWSKVADLDYLISGRKTTPHAYTDSASSATSMTSGIKTYNAAINFDCDGKQVEPIARELQKNGFAIGVVTSVPISHATPACAYANNVHRNDYQDLTRDMLGLPSSSHRDEALPGLDLLIGCGWGERLTEASDVKNEVTKQGANFVPDNRYISDEDFKSIDVRNGGRYRVAQRTENMPGADVLSEAVDQAIKQKNRLFGFFGTKYSHLPFQTADGDYKPTRGNTTVEVYSDGDIKENPTLAQMTESALRYLENNEKGFWLMIEAGDVDWANHANNIDDSIGAVFSGDAAFKAVADWADAKECWDETCVILTADHGHLFVLTDPAVLTGESTKSESSK